MPADKLDRIVEAVRFAPTTSGRQPFELLLGSKVAIRAQICVAAWNQAQITACSHLLMFAAWDDSPATRIPHLFDLTNNMRGFKNEGWETYRHQLLDIVAAGGRKGN